MAQNRSYDPPIAVPPATPPRTVLQVDTQSEVSESGAIPKSCRAGGRRAAAADHPG